MTDSDPRSGTPPADPGNQVQQGCLEHPDTLSDVAKPDPSLANASAPSFRTVLPRLRRLTSLWRDPVWSKVIASAITATFVACALFLNSRMPFLGEKIASRNNPKGIAAARECNLQVDVTGMGSGDVSSDDESFSPCSKTCARRLPSGTRLVLTAKGSIQSLFMGWRGACTGNSLCTVRVDRDLQVEAIFAETSVVVVRLAGTGSGLVSAAVDQAHLGGEIDRLSCRADCTRVVPRGTRLAFHATPDAESSFIGWRPAGSAAGSADYNLKADGGHHEVIAEFRKREKSSCKISFLHGEGDSVGTMVFKQCACPGKSSVRTEFGRRIENERLKDRQYLIKATNNLALPEGWSCEK